ncbi:MAG: hypothetical protein ACYTF9_03535 [Planctomycetota bacterium]|jgi:hypothetical protein
MRACSGGERIGRLGRGRALVVSLGLVAGLHAPLAAQVLQLGPGEPPPLPAPSGAQRTGMELDREIAAALARSQQPGSPAAVVTRAAIDLRVIAAELLQYGSSAGTTAGADRAILIGTQLADARGAIDAALDRLVPASDGGGVDDRAALDALQSFSLAASALSRQLRDEPAIDLDARIPAALTSLADAVESVLGTAVRSHWPTKDVINDERTPSSRLDEGPPSIAALRDALVAAPLALETSSALSAQLDFLDRGEAFPDLRPRIRAYRVDIARTLEVAGAIDTARGWLDEAIVASLENRLHRAVTLLGDPLTRERGTAALGRLLAARSLLERVSRLASDPRADLEPVVAAFHAADRVLALESGDPPEATVRTIVAILDRMIRRREHPAEEARSDMRTTQRRLLQRCRETEAALVERLTQAVGPMAMADPDFASLVESHRQLLTDVERLARIPGWIAAAERIDQRAGNGVATRCRVLSARLLDPARRGEALALMDRLETELDRYAVLPLEEALRSGDATALQLCGGLEAPLLATIERQRRRWIGAWGKGEPDGGAREIALLHTLCEAMSDNAGLLRLGDGAAVINRWAAWDLSVEAMQRAVVGLPARLKVAVAEAIDGTADGLERQLDAIERDTPLARLLGRLADRLGATLESYPAGASGTLGQLVIGPGEDAWLVHRRDDLARLSRYAREEAAARLAGQQADAARLAEYVGALAEALLEEVT